MSLDALDLDLERDSRVHELEGTQDAGDGGDEQGGRGGPPYATIEDVLSLAGDVGTNPGLGLLVDLARRGEFDPWDVDIVSLTDRYLAALLDLDPRDLVRVARVIFYAAALVHLKAQALAAEEAARAAAEQAVLAGDDAPLDLTGLGEDGSRLRPGDRPLVYPTFLRNQEGEVVGLLPRERPMRPRGLTLLDLIVALRDYDERCAQREAELAALPELDEGAAHVECVGSSHQDDLDRDIVTVREDLWTRLPAGGDEGLPSPDDELELEALVRPDRGRAATYLALLFLAQDEEVELVQDELYGRLTVRRGRSFGEVKAGVLVMAGAAGPEES